jgi:hypothetical protein
MNDLLLKIQRRLLSPGRRLHVLQRQAVHHRDAFTALQGVLRHPGVRPLTRALRRTVDDYAQEELGDRRFAPWLRTLATFHGELVPGWIPDDYFALVALPEISTRYHGLGSARSLATRILRTDILPDLVYRVSGRWYDPEGNVVPETAVHDRVFESGQVAYVKSERSRQGRGVRRITPETYESVLPSFTGNVVIQRGIVQGPFFDALSPGCTATLRLGTAVAAGEDPHLAFATLKVGTGSAQHIRTADGLHIPIHLETGRLADLGVLGHWSLVHSHPDNGTVFGGLEVPGLLDAIDVCLRLHRSVPQFGLIGWDIAINTAGHPELMEWNTGHVGIMVPQLLIGPVLRRLRLERLRVRVDRIPR